MVMLLVMVETLMVILVLMLVQCLCEMTEPAVLGRLLIAVRIVELVGELAAVTMVILTALLGKQTMI